MRYRYLMFLHPLGMLQWLVNWIFWLLEDKISLWHFCLLLWSWNKCLTISRVKESRNICSWCLFIHWEGCNGSSTSSLDSLKTEFLSATFGCSWDHESSVQLSQEVKNQEKCHWCLRIHWVCWNWLSTASLGSFKCLLTKVATKDVERKSSRQPA